MDDAPEQGCHNSSQGDRHKAKGGRYDCQTFPLYRNPGFDPSNVPGVCLEQTWEIKQGLIDCFCLYYLLYMWETYDFNYLKHFITHNRDTYCNHHFCHFRLLGMEPSQFLSHAHGNCWHSETTAALFLKRFLQRNRPSNPISNLVCFTHTPEKNEHIVQYLIYLFIWRGLIGSYWRYHIIITYYYCHIIGKGLVGSLTVILEGPLRLFFDKQGIDQYI